MLPYAHCIQDCHLHFQTAFLAGHIAGSLYVWRASVIMYPCGCSCSCVHVYVHVCVCVCLCVCVCAHACMPLCLLYACVCLYLLVCACTDARTFLLVCVFRYVSWLDTQCSRLFRVNLSIFGHTSDERTYVLLVCQINMVCMFISCLSQVSQCFARSPPL